MKDIQTSLAGLMLVKPNPDRDASFAYSWFNSDHGRDTLLKMGNAQKHITTATLEKEVATLEEFIDLEKSGKQLTWMMRIDNKTVGAVWIELYETEYLRSPAVHIMIGDIQYRGQGIGKASMNAMIDVAKNNLQATTIYSRHLSSNDIVIKLNSSLGFEMDGLPYTDVDGLTFQNVLKVL
ncbi:MAG: GNAT family N-acetyltransferase [Candidatus Saccharimonadales bacterium]